MRITVVFVHWHTPDLLSAAVSAIHADARSAGLGCDVIVVDNGSNLEDATRLKQLPARWIQPHTNLGYAGGINRGISASPSDVYVVLNPDVLVHSGCLAALVGALESGADVVGPRFVWDPGQQLFMPPLQQYDFRSEALRGLSRRGNRWATMARQLARRHALRHWTATQPIASWSLCGALLAFTHKTWTTVGPFDAAYRLYFEETDWLNRCARRGLIGRYVPEAIAEHAYNASAKQNPEATRWFLESQARYRNRYGRLGRTLLETIDRLPAREAAGVRYQRSELAPKILFPTSQRATASRWIEISHSPFSSTSVGYRMDDPNQDTWQLPQAVWSRGDLPSLVITLIDEFGHEQSRTLYERAAPHSQLRCA